MSSLYHLTIAAILSLARAPAVDVDAERPRLERLAAAITSAVEERDALAHWLGDHVEPLPFRGPAAREATALAEVALAFHESRFRAEVEDCRIVGADHPSITPFQLLGPFAFGGYTRRQLCGSVRLAAERSLAVFAHHGRRCSTPARWFAGYASGDCGRPSDASRRQCAIWEHLAREAGLSASCSSPTARRRIETY